MFHSERQKNKLLVLSGDFYSLSQFQRIAHYKTKSYSYSGTRNTNFVVSDKAFRMFGIFNVALENFRTFAFHKDKGF